MPADEEERLEWERVVERLEGGGLAGPQWVSWRARISRRSRERRLAALAKVDEPEVAWVQPDMFQVLKRKERSLRVRGSSTRGGVESESMEGGEGGPRAECCLEQGGQRGVWAGGHGQGVTGGLPNAGTEGSAWQGSSPCCGEPSVAPGQAGGREYQDRRLEIGAHSTLGDAARKGILQEWLPIAPAAPTPTGGVPTVLPPLLLVTLPLLGIPVACVGRELASLLFMWPWLRGGGLLPIQER
jgi:hypothetical protein